MEHDFSFHNSSSRRVKLAINEDPEVLKTCGAIHAAVDVEKMSAGAGLKLRAGTRGMVTMDLNPGDSKVHKANASTIYVRGGFVINEPEQQAHYLLFWGAEGEGRPCVAGQELTISDERHWSRASQDRLLTGNICEPGKPTALARERAAAPGMDVPHAHAHAHAAAEAALQQTAGHHSNHGVTPFAPAARVMIEGKPAYVYKDEGGPVLYCVMREQLKNAGAGCKLANGDKVQLGPPESDNAVVIEKDGVRYYALKQDAIKKPYSRAVVVPR